MHYAVVFFTIAVVTYCGPLPDDSEASILNYTYSKGEKGNYKYRYETSNGIIREETGILVNIGLSNEHIFVSGSYSYLDPEGKNETVNYVAGEMGFVIIIPYPSNVRYSEVTPAVLATLLGK